MGGAAKTVGRVASGVLTLGGSEIARNNLPARSILNQGLNLPGTILTGGMYNPGSIPGLPNPSNPGQTTSGPFSIDPAQIAADQASINALGTQQRQATDAFNTGDQANRAAGRDALASALTKQSQAYFKQGLPDTEETLNAQHLLNGSGLGQEIARQQGNLATNIANQVGVQGMNDINRSSDLGLSGLQQQQGAQSAALSRGFSLNDFINQANVAKAIGAQAAPQVGNGKGQTGALLSGVGSLAPLVGAATGGPAGKAAGTAAAATVKNPYNWHDAQSDPTTGLG